MARPADTLIEAIEAMEQDERRVSASATGSGSGDGAPIIEDVTEGDVEANAQGAEAAEGAQDDAPPEDADAPPQDALAAQAAPADQTAPLAQLVPAAEGQQNLVQQRQLRQRIAEKRIAEMEKSCARELSVEDWKHDAWTGADPKACGLTTAGAANIPWGIWHSAWLLLGYVWIQPSGDVLLWRWNQDRAVQTWHLCRRLRILQACFLLLK